MPKRPREEPSLRTAVPVDTDGLTPIVAAVLRRDPMPCPPIAAHQRHHELQEGQTPATESERRSTEPLASTAPTDSPASLPVVVSVKKAALNARGTADFAAWAADARHIYVGRGMTFYVPGTTQSVYHNPFTLKKHTLAESLSKYEAHVRSTPALWDGLVPTFGGASELACWCAPGPCHAEVIARLMAERWGWPSVPPERAVETVSPKAPLPLPTSNSDGVDPLPEPSQPHDRGAPFSATPLDRWVRHGPRKDTQRNDISPHVDSIDVDACGSDDDVISVSDD